jgi:Xaa-Pro dipeptidase
MAVVRPSEQGRLVVVGRAEPEHVWVEDVRPGHDVVPLLLEALPAGAKRVGVAGWESFPTAVYARLAAALPLTAFEPASDLLLELRRIKSPAEVEVMRAAARIAQRGVEAMYAAARPGVRERDLLATYEHAVRTAGSDELPFATQVAGGPRTAQVTAHATDRVLEPGDVVRSDSGALYQGYCADISRATMIGPVDREVGRILDTGAEIYQSCLAMIKPGVRFDSLVATARSIARRAGLEEYLGTLTVHGIGCNQDEYPHWSTGAAVPDRWVRGVPRDDADTGFEVGMVCCFEPGLYVPGRGGIRLEEPFVVTPDGVELLTHDLPVRLWD